MKTGLQGGFINKAELYNSFFVKQRTAINKAVVCRLSFLSNITVSSNDILKIIRDFD